MTFSSINVSNPNDGLGDKLRDAFIIVNDNFASIGDIVTPEYIAATLSNYATIDYVTDELADVDAELLGLIDRVETLETDVDTLQTGFNNLTLSVNGKVSTTTFNNSISAINDTISDLNNSKIGDAPADGKEYVRKDNDWSEANAALPYKSYTVLITQESTDDPTVVILQNDFDATITPKYANTGVYRLSADSSIFTAEKTICFYTAYDTKGWPGSITEVKLQWWSTSEIYIYTNGQDDALRASSLEIRVYN